VELLESENGMVGLGASKFLLGVGAGVTMPQPAGATVNIAIGERAGYVIDVSESDSDQRRLVVSPADSSGPLIDGEAREIEAPPVDVEPSDRR